MKAALLAPISTRYNTDPQCISLFAQYVEASGRESVLVAEHNVMPSRYSSAYPFDARPAGYGRALASAIGVGADRVGRGGAVLPAVPAGTDIDEPRDLLSACAERLGPMS